MKVLFIVTYLYPRGGDSNHAFAVAEELKAKGHKVFFFGMRDDKNFPELPGPFAPRVDYREVLKKKNPISLLKALGSIYSFPSKKAISRFIDIHGPFDLAHIHSTHHQLTMSVLDVLKKRKIPFLWTLHDYKLICPNTTLFDESAGIKCPSPGTGIPFCVAKRKCKKSSLPASLLTAIESWFNYAGGYYNYPECYVSPSTFLRNLIKHTNVTSRPINVIPNFSPHLPDKNVQPLGNDFLFIGRLATVKGVDILINAFASVQKNISGKLIIVGSGPAEEELKALAASLLPPERYEFTGHIDSASDVARYYHQARCMVLPAVWYENMPLSILEAFAHARPVIGSDIGGIPEMVVEGETGLLFKPGSVTELAEKLVCYGTDCEKASKTGLNGWKTVKDNFSRANYIKEILQVYEKVVAGKYSK